MIAVVTGASSGFGFSICRELKNKGCTVYGLSRRGTAPEGVCGISVDLLRREDAEAVFRSIIEKEGRIDLLINNAGAGIFGPLEFADPEHAAHLLDVNVIASLTCTRLVLPLMRVQRSGTVLFVSSVAAEIAVPYQAMYSATKAAVNGMALALRNEVKEFGIRVAVIEPGDACTGFTDARESDLTHDSVYSHSSTVRGIVEKDERGGMSADYVASQIVRVAFSLNPRPIYVVGGKYRWLTALYHILPVRFSYWIVGKIYY